MPTQNVITTLIVFEICSLERLCPVLLLLQSQTAYTTCFQTQTGVRSSLRLLSSCHFYNLPIASGPSCTHAR